MTKEEVLKALQTANNAPYTPAPPSGCGRAYVCVQGDKDLLRFVAASCKKMGLLFERKGHYGTGSNSIYIGYDNADGRAIAKSKVFAETLKTFGIGAYDDAVAD